MKSMENRKVYFSNLLDSFPASSGWVKAGLTMKGMGGMKIFTELMVLKKKAF
jgi:hypothetical protein